MGSGESAPLLYEQNQLRGQDEIGWEDFQLQFIS